MGTCVCRNEETHVGSSGETDTLGTVLKREDLRTIDPSSRSPGKSVNADKDV